MPGCVQDSIILICLSVCECATFVVFADCKGCTRPVPTNPGPMEAGEYGVMCGTCFVASRLEVVAIAGLPWISWCVLGAAGFRGCFFVVFSFERTHPAASMRPPCLFYLSASNEAFFVSGKKASSYRGAYSVHFLISPCNCLSFCLSVCMSFCLSVCLPVCVCVTFVVFTDCESCTRPISANPGPMEAGEYGLTRGTCLVASHLELVAVAGLLWISWCVLGRAGFFSLFFFLRTHTA